MNQVLDTDQALDVSVDGYALVTTPLLNKGTAFTGAERDQFGLHGLLPPHIGSLEDQSERRLGEFFMRKTVKFNGYGDQVAQLYAGMDLRKNY